MITKAKRLLCDYKGSKNLLELEVSARHISDGVAAARIIVLGLKGMGSEYVGMFRTVWNYLAEAEREFQNSSLSVWRQYKKERQTRLGLPLFFTP